jgi:hypothetical protein
MVEEEKWYEGLPQGKEREIKGEINVAIENERRRLKKEIDALERKREEYHEHATWFLGERITREGARRLELMKEGGELVKSEMVDEWGGWAVAENSRHVEACIGIIKGLVEGKSLEEVRKEVFQRAGISTSDAKAKFIEEKALRFRREF